MSAPQAPSLPQRLSSSMVMGITGLISKCFLYGTNRVEVIGMPQFLELLNSRQDPRQRQRGLITVANHISVVDDPLIWGVLPLGYVFSPSTLRWGLGAHDICFKNKFLSDYFAAGQVLPTHRLKHSPHGGLFQPSITQAIRLLSAQPFGKAILSPSYFTSHEPEGLPDPFTTGELTYTTTGSDVNVAPSSYESNRHSWVHVFPEGMIHQHPTVDMRYFKWGIARLILESEPSPDVVPMFIDGTQQIMHEDRTFPRFLPRFGKHVRVAFGEKLDFEETFGDLRRRWRDLAQRRSAARLAEGKESGAVEMLGQLQDHELQFGDEANEIRTEVARLVRESVLKVRASMGYPKSDPTFAYAETWAKDEKDPLKKKYKSRVDDSEINQD